MKPIVVYASKHGTTKNYAEHFAKRANLDVISYKDLKKHLQEVSSVVFFTSVYFNKATGVKELLKLNSSVEVTFVTVGISTYDDTALKQSVKKQVGNHFTSIEFYHLRGAVDNSNLKSVERLIIHMVAKSKMKKEENKTDFEKIFQDGKASFVDYDKLNYIYQNFK